MRIRLRVPPEEDAEPGDRRKQRGFLDEFFGFFSSSPEPAPLPQPRFDHRWCTRGEVRYFFTGRFCRPSKGSWLSEYIYDVFAGNELRKMRIILPETLVQTWEQAHGQRMSEALRFRLVRETLETLLSHSRFPASADVPPDAVKAAAS